MKYYIPNQHGAWAMLIVPFLFGMVAGESRPIHILLFICWLLIYLLMFPLLGWIRTRKTDRYRGPILLYGTVLLPLAIWLIMLQSDILWMSLMFIPLFFVNTYYAKQKRERDLINDIAAIVQFSLMVFISYYVGGGKDYLLAVELFIVSVLYFVGTAFYVKTIIREKNNKPFYYLSVIYHCMLVVLSSFLVPWPLIISAGILLLRSVWFPKTKITIKQSGIMEIVYSIIVLVIVWIVYGI